MLQRLQNIRPRMHRSASPSSPAQDLPQVDDSCFLQSEQVKGKYMQMSPKTNSGHLNTMVKVIKCHILLYFFKYLIYIQLFQ